MVSEGVQIKAIAVFQLIETQNIVPAKFLKTLEGTKLFEARVAWQFNIYRFPCFFEKEKVVIVTHGFQKKTMKAVNNGLKVPLFSGFRFPVFLDLHRVNDPDFQPVFHPV
ncbi:type II toxin-antitoxin system RelE/ParE family toxin [Alkalispirochaeta sphaeroplastigenens]|uniref:type II toxin-antitoxin system RelE/ParE family toxin n=1 Tax=Alkalispirochaeta sphaeroplastigenens TaxID=1187066 RepID=UPI000CDB7A9B